MESQHVMGLRWKKRALTAPSAAHVRPMIGARAVLGRIVSNVEECLDGCREMLPKVGGIDNHLQPRHKAFVTPRTCERELEAITRASALRTSL